MKRILAVLISLILVMQAGIVLADEYPTATVIVDGVEIVFDQPAVIINSRTLVPLRAIFEALGASVLWNGETSSVIAKKGTTTISLQIGSNRVYKSTPYMSDYFEIDVSAMLLNSRTLVPVRAISEALDASVGWDGDTKTVTVESKNKYVKDYYLTETNRENDILYYDILINYPQFEGYNALNEKIKSIYENKFEEVKNRKSIDAKADYEGSLSFGWMFMPHNYELLTETTYEKDGIICILSHETDFAGGVHPITNKISYIFNAATGEFVDVDKSYALDAFKAMIEADKERFNENALDILSEDIIGCYMTDESYIYYINPDVIAPHAEGFIEVNM